MTGTEFKAWLEGYCEQIDGKPSRHQLDRIREQAAKIVQDGCSCYRWNWYTLTSRLPTIPYTHPYPIFNWTSDSIQISDVSWQGQAP